MKDDLTVVFAHVHNMHELTQINSEIILQKPIKQLLKETKTEGNLQRSDRQGNSDVSCL